MADEINQSLPVQSSGGPELTPATKYSAAIAEVLKEMVERESRTIGAEERLEAEYIQQIFEAVAKKTARGEPTGWERE